MTDQETTTKRAGREAPLPELERPPKTERTERLRARVVDDQEDGDRWQREADARWRKALGTTETEEGALDVYIAPELPDFRARAAKVIRRPDVFGRYLVDRDLGVIHDVYQAKAACEVDSVPNGTYFHFGHELLEADASELEPCPRCLGARQ